MSTAGEVVDDDLGDLPTGQVVTRGGQGETAGGGRGVESDNPRYSGAEGQSSQREENEERAAPRRNEGRDLEAGLPVADEFGGYFSNRETMVAAWGVLFVSVVAAIVVTGNVTHHNTLSHPQSHACSLFDIASQLYRLFVLDPPCEFVNVTGTNLTLGCNPNDSGADATSTVFVILISFTIPACGLYGSIKQVVEVLQIFRLV